ncbi:MAG: BamA/TamA family outer membrane protein [Kofleriaceae bacterium]|nr:BamA/TamA family outer membrane protein [Kofleriaceae bacterium]
MRTRSTAAVILATLAVVAGGPAHAQPQDLPWSRVEPDAAPEPGPDADGDPDGDADGDPDVDVDPPPPAAELPDDGVAPRSRASAAPLGPVIVIERIDIEGNRSTLDSVIRRALPIVEGDALRASDPRLRDARFKLLALGFFRDVNLALRKGSARGQVILTVTVVERGTIVLNRLWFGTSVTSPWWLGADVGERNFLGTGLSVGGGLVFAGHGDVVGSRDQWAAELRVADPSLFGSTLGWRGSFTWVHGSEPYRVGGDPDDAAAANFRAFPYQRVVGRAGLTWDARALSRLSADLRVEAIDAELPVAPTRALPDGRITAVDLSLRPGSSEVVSLALGFDHDTRSDPVLPRHGGRFTAHVELGSTLLGGSYDFAVLLARWERWWPAGGRGAWGVRAAGGVILGDAPRFDRIHVADVNRLLTPRALGLVVSAQGSPDFLGAGTDDKVYGQVGGSGFVEYARPLFRRTRTIYGGDLFVGAGLWALADRDDLRVRDTPVWSALPVDLVVDAGLRLDTEIGIFELTIANALGRVPL